MSTTPEDGAREPAASTSASASIAGESEGTPASPTSIRSFGRVAHIERADGSTEKQPVRAEQPERPEEADASDQPRRSGPRSAITRVWSDVGQVVDAARKVPPREAVAYGGLALVAVAGIVELPVVAAIAGVAWLTSHRGRSTDR